MSASHSSDLKSWFSTAMHSVGPSGSSFCTTLICGLMLSSIWRPITVASMRGSVATVAGSGGGTLSCASQPNSGRWRASFSSR